MSEELKKIDPIDRLRVDQEALAHFCHLTEAEVLNEDDPTLITVRVGEHLLLGVGNGDIESLMALREIQIPIVGKQMVEQNPGYYVGYFKEGDHSPLPVFLPAPQENIQ